MLARIRASVFPNCLPVLCRVYLGYEGCILFVFYNNNLPFSLLIKNKQNLRMYYEETNRVDTKWRGEREWMSVRTSLKHKGH
ncbi:hypothetical protein NIES4073_81690 [Kalymmatonema gypsitolerans NIES-4073]|nr:hypothetical protein NIES4073_81690 [Scytonema sp. NIES-4073]